MSTHGRYSEMRRRKKHALPPALWAVLGSLGGFSVLGVLGLVPAVDGKPLLAHLSPIVAQTLSTAAIVLPIVLPYVVRTHRDSAASAEQLQNDHSKNLREEGDERHGQTLAALTGIQQQLDSHSRQLGHVVSGLVTVSGEVRDLKEADKGLAARMSDVEDTMNPEREGYRPPRFARSPTAPIPVVINDDSETPYPEGGPHDHHRPRP